MEGIVIVLEIVRRAWYVRRLQRMGEKPSGSGSLEVVLQVNWLGMPWITVEATAVSFAIYAPDF